MIILFHEPPILKTKRFVSAFASRTEDSDNWSVITTEHGEVVDNRPGVSQTPFHIGERTVEALKRWGGAETLVGPSVGQAAVPQINKTALLHLITKSINTSKIRPTRT